MTEGRKLKARVAVGALFLDKQRRTGCAGGVRTYTAFSVPSFSACCITLINVSVNCSLAPHKHCICIKKLLVFAVTVEDFIINIARYGCTWLHKVQWWWYVINNMNVTVDWVKLNIEWAVKRFKLLFAFDWSPRPSLVSGSLTCQTDTKLDTVICASLMHFIRYISVCVTSLHTCSAFIYTNIGLLSLLFGNSDTVKIWTRLHKVWVSFL